MSQMLTDTIASLYAETELAMASAEQPITPLGLLIRNVGLIGAEITGLTVSTASDFLLKRGGAVEPLPPLTEGPLAGFLCVVPKYGGCVFVEHKDIFTRRRFSVAHELGHYLLHFRPQLINTITFDQPMLDAFPITKADDVEPGNLPQGQMTLSNMDITDQTFEQMEREANEFAAELLMPAEVVLALCAHYQLYLNGDDLALRLAGEMLVSRAAMRWRLRKLGINMPPEPQLN